jgi:hypothetical protein
MIAEWQFTKAVEEFKKVLKEDVMVNNIIIDTDVYKSYDSLNEYIRTEFKEFASAPDSQRKIMDNLRFYRNSKKESVADFTSVNVQRDLIVSLVKGYLNHVGTIQNFEVVTW